MKTRIAASTLVLATLAGMGWCGPVLTLTPSSSVTGGRGSTLGWGYSFSNDTGLYLLVDSSQFCESGQDPLFTACSPTLGTYTDFIASNVTIIAPNSTTSQNFNSGLPAGVGSYVVAANAPVSTDSGSLIVTFQEFQGNPLAGGTQITGDLEVSAAASVQAVAPEPTSFPLAGVALFLIGILGWKRRRTLP
jgi:hypothetical protein